MVRILQVVTHMNRGGLETMIMNYYRHTDRSQVQFDFLVHRTERAAFDDEIEALGGIIYRLPTLNPFSVRYKKALSKFFDEHPEYMVVHVHQDCMSSVILKEAQKHDVPVRIAHSHCANQDKNLKYPVKIYYQRRIPQYATHLFACGTDAGNWMFRGAEFTILNNAISTLEYRYDEERRKQIREVLGITNNTLLIGHVGRFNPQKNHVFLIDVFKHICMNKEAKLLLVGDGSLRTEIEEKVRREHLEDKVIFAGLRRDVPDLLQAMDVFVFPSNYEGLPVTIIEAQASGLPCLISDKVPIECKRTELVQQIPLDASLDIWRQHVIEVSKVERKDTYKEIKAAGFDIHENANKLQQFYLQVSRGE